MEHEAPKTYRSDDLFGYRQIMDDPEELERIRLMIWPPKAPPTFWQRVWRVLAGLLVLAVLWPDLARAQGLEDTRQSKWKTRAAYLAAGAADLTASELAFRTGLAVEGNPMLKNRATRIVVVLGGALLAAELDLDLGRKGKHKAQKFARAGYFTVSAAKVGLGLRFVF